MGVCVGGAPGVCTCVYVSVSGRSCPWAYVCRACSASARAAMWPADTCARSQAHAPEPAPMSALMASSEPDCAAKKKADVCSVSSCALAAAQASSPRAPLASTSAAHAAAAVASHAPRARGGMAASGGLRASVWAAVKQVRPRFPQVCVPPARPPRVYALCHRGCHCPAAPRPRRWRSCELCSQPQPQIGVNAAECCAIISIDSLNQ